METVVRGRSITGGWTAVSVSDSSPGSMRSLCKRRTRVRLRQRKRALGYLPSVLFAVEVGAGGGGRGWRV